MHIVFIVGSYYPYYSAVGKCVGNVADELSKEHKVTVICQKNHQNQLDQETYNNHKIIRIATKDILIRNSLNEKINISKGINRYAYKIMGGIYKISKSLEMILSKYSIKRDLVIEYSKALESIEEHIDAIIPASMPFESVIAASEYKQNVENEIIMIPYLFDHFVNNKSLHRTQLIEDFKREKHLKLEKQVLDYANFVFITPQLKNYFKIENKRYDNKFITVEHPLLKRYSGIPAKNSDAIKFIYTGSFYKKIRNPEYMLKFMDSALIITRARLDLYTFGNCDEIINWYAKKSEFIIPHGSVSTEKAYSAIQNADFLVAVGNSDNSQVPSKTFEYISFGKPIIYFYSNEDDASLKVLAKYPLALCLLQSDKAMKENKVKFEKFCKEKYNSTVSFNEVENLFIDATPKYNARLIEKSILDSIR